MTQSIRTEAQVMDFVPGLCVQVVSNARTTWAGTGVANLEFGVPITVDTRANFGSVAKQITAHLIVLSARNRQLRLDDLVQRHLPRFELSGVTILDLLRHRGGVRDAESLLSLAGFREWDHYTATDLLEVAYRQRTHAGRDGAFLYSNTGYLLLTAILEVVHSSPLNTIAYELVFSRLGMSNTAFRSHPDQVLTNSACAYARNADGRWRYGGRPVALAGPGSIWSTVADMDRWLMYVWEHWASCSLDRLPFEEDVPYLHASPMPFSYGPGLCAVIGRGGNKAQIFHAGHEHGFSASVHVDRGGKRTICWSNRADLRADAVTSRLANLTFDRQQPLSEGDLLTFVNDEITRSSQTRLHGSRHAAPIDLVTLGTFRCEEIPGSVRLSRSPSSSSIFLWRRGTVDELTLDASSSVYKGAGMTVELDEASTSGPSNFILHLERAPDIHYSRTSD